MRSNVCFSGQTTSERKPRPPQADAREGVRNLAIDAGYRLSGEALTWDEGPDAATAGGEHSRVVVEFLEDGDGTLVRLTHTGFANEQIRELHVEGWQAVLANLERAVFA